MMVSSLSIIAILVSLFSKCHTYVPTFAPTTNAPVFTPTLSPSDGAAPAPVPTVSPTDFESGLGEDCERCVNDDRKCWWCYQMSERTGREKCLCMDDGASCADDGLSAWTGICWNYNTCESCLAVGGTWCVFIPQIGQSWGPKCVTHSHHLTAWCPEEYYERHTDTCPSSAPSMSLVLLYFGIPSLTFLFVLWSV